MRSSQMLTSLYSPPSRRPVVDHTWMFNVPCFQTVVTCGRACDKPLPRCSHRCRRACHAGACLPTPLHESASGTLERECSQPCPRARPDCGHPCGLPCHDRNPETVLPGDVTAPASFCAKSLGKLRCKVPIELVCACGHRQEDLPCYQVRCNIPTLNYLPSSTVKQYEPFFILFFPSLVHTSNCLKKKRNSRIPIAPITGGRVLLSMNPSRRHRY